MSNIYLGLVHYPVINKFQEVVTTSITNLDIHDIARSCKTFGVKTFFVINPLETQRELLERVLKFWKSKIAVEYNPHRVEALSLIKYVPNVEQVINIINKQEEEYPLIITTSAVRRDPIVGFREILDLKKPRLLLFGTGNGLASIIHEKAHYILEPIKGTGEYNHLSVRSAVAVVLDRLTSEK